MPRPVSIQDDLILRAAREIFLEKGLEATTSEIAAKAGVSHGIIFKRFKTKQGLFQSAMREDSDWGGKIALLLNPKLGGQDVETTLIELGSLFVEKFLLIIPMLMMSWSNRQEDLSPTEATAIAGKQRAARSSASGQNRGRLLAGSASPGADPRHRFRSGCASVYRRPLASCVPEGNAG